MSMSKISTIITPKYVIINMVWQVSLGASFKIPILRQITKNKRTKNVEITLDKTSILLIISSRMMNDNIELRIIVTSININADIQATDRYQRDNIITENKIILHINKEPIHPFNPVLILFLFFMVNLSKRYCWIALFFWSSMRDSLTFNFFVIFVIIFFFLFSIGRTADNFNLLLLTFGLKNLVVAIIFFGLLVGVLLILLLTIIFSSITYI